MKKIVLQPLLQFKEHSYSYKLSNGYASDESMHCEPYFFRHFLIHVPLFLLLTLCFLLLSNIGNAQPRQNVFLSFENKEEIQKLSTSKGVKLAQSKHFTTWEENSLQVEFPRDGGKIKLTDIPTDWRQRTGFFVFAWSKQPSELAITLEDAEGNTFRRVYSLRTGANHIQMDLRKARSMQWANMETVELEGTIGGKLYLDYIALHQYNKFLEARGRYDFHLKSDIQTPHINWADPLKGGPLDIYAIHGGRNGRSIIELAQRLEVNFEAATVGFRYGFGEFYHQRAGKPYYTYILDDMLYGKDNDVILWPAIEPWGNYPKKIRQEIMRQVKEEGKGLVFFMPYTNKKDGAGLWELSPLTHPDQDVPVDPGTNAERSEDSDLSPWRKSKEHFITRGLDFETFPQGQMTVIPSRTQGEVLIETENGSPVLAVQNVGKGRVAAFGYRPKGMIPEVSNIWDTGLHYRYWDHMWSMVARTVVWAADKEPEAAITGINREAQTVQVTLNGDVPSARLTGQLTDSYGEILANYNTSVNAGAKSANIELPDSLSGGRNILSLKLVGSDGSLDWFSATIRQEPKVNIARLTTNRDQVEKGDDVKAEISLHSDLPAKCKISAGLYDNYGRLLSEKQSSHTVDGGLDKEWTFSTKGAQSHLAHVKVKVSDPDGTIHAREESEVFILQDREWDHFDIVMYRFGPDPMPGIWPVIDRQLRNMYVTTLSSYTAEHSKHANYLVQAQTRVSGQESPDGGPRRKYYEQMKDEYLETGDKMVLKRNYCLNDPDYRKLIQKELDNLMKPWIPFSPLSYYVYEEPSLTVYDDAADICFSKHCMRDMRKWLRKEYGSLDALNQQWGTDFSKWGNVIPDDYKEAQKRGNYSSWADHRTFMERTYAQSYKMIREELRKRDPGSLVLNSGTQASSPHNGCDYSRLDQYTRHLNPYGSYNLHRSMNPNVKISGQAGYGEKGKYVLHNYYRNLFKGANGGQYIFWQYCTVDPDLTLNKSSRDMIEGSEELRGQGIGKLVGQAKTDNHGIAIHYSYPSLHGAWIVDGQVKDGVSYNITSTSPSGGRFESNTEGWKEILKDCGLQYDFLAYSHLEEGRLMSKGYDTFVLPMSVALSDEEIDQLARFVKAGGTVISDGLPGVMDEHCAFRDNSKIQEIFGIEAPKSDAQEIINAKGDPDLELNGARTLEASGGKPEMLVNEYGQGKAYMLNYFLHDYLEDKKNDKHREQLNDIKTVLNTADKKPKIQLTGEDGERLSGCPLYLFNNGSTKLLGLSPNMQRESEEQIQVQLDKEYNIYDVRNRRYIGAGERFQIKIEAGVPKLYALISGKIDDVNINAPERASLGEQINVKITISGPEQLESVACVTVTDPNGNEHRYYGDNLDIENGSAAFSFRTALNDVSGEWLVEVTETMSGERSQKVIRIE